MNQINVQPGQKIFEFTEKEYTITEITGPFPDVEDVRIADRVENINVCAQQQPIFPNVKKLVIENNMVIGMFYYWERLFTTIDTISLQFAETFKTSYLKCLGNYTSNFEVTEQNPDYMAIDGILYSKDGTRVIRCPKLKKGAICITEGVQIIDKLASEGCSLSTVTFPQSLKQIQIGAFQYCDNLSQVDFFDGIETIEKWAFDGCEKLHMVTLPSSIRTLGQHCFSCVQNIYLKSDRFPDGIVDSISAPWSSTGFATITNNAQTIIIPKDLTWSSIRGLEAIIQNAPIDQKTLNTMFFYADTEECKLKTAFAIYQRFQSPEAAQYLREHSLEALNLFIEEKQDKQIIDFVQLGFASLNDLKSLLAAEYIQNNPTVKAYILQSIKYHTGRTNNIFKL